MIEFKITGLGIDTRSNNPLVLLHSEDNWVLPIWIGRLEAQSIAIALQGEKLERPLAHDLILNLIEKTGYEMNHIEIKDVKDGTFYANLVLKNLNSEDLLTLDARPSDCIAIAIRSQVPILISDFVKEVSCIPAIIREGNNEDYDEEENLFGRNISPLDESNKEDFLNFLKDVKASDFKLPES